MEVLDTENSGDVVLTNSDKVGRQWPHNRVEMGSIVYYVRYYLYII